MTDRQIDRQVYLYSAYEFNRVTKRQAADGPSSIELSWQYLRRSTGERGHAVHHTERPALRVCSTTRRAGPSAGARSYRRKLGDFVAVKPQLLETRQRPDRVRLHNNNDD